MAHWVAAKHTILDIGGGKKMNALDEWAQEQGKEDWEQYKENDREWPLLENLAKGAENEAKKQVVDKVGRILVGALTQIQEIKGSIEYSHRSQRKPTNGTLVQGKE